MTRRSFLAITMACLVAIPAAWGQGYPTKPIRVIVGYTAGGAVDVVARAVSQQLQGGLGQPIIVENRPGAGTNIALRALIDSPQTATR